MNNTRIAALIVIVGFAGHPAVSRAQGPADDSLKTQLASSLPDSSHRGLAFSDPIGVHAPSKADVRVERTREISPGVQDDRSNPALYFLTGAAIGAVGLGGAAAIAVSGCSETDSCMFAGPAVLVAGGVGALVGGLMGLLAYAVHPGNREPTTR
jgi:hypothetical protein